MKRAVVYCIEPENRSGNLDFYIRVNNEDHYLFRQTYRTGVHQYFGGGVDVDKALKCNWNKHDRAVLRTIDKLPSYIKYIEKEQGIAILDKAKRKGAYA